MVAEPREGGTADELAPFEFVVLSTLATGRSRGAACVPA